MINRPPGNLAHPQKALSILAAALSSRNDFVLVVAWMLHA
jgi:hypothetical protein